MRGYYLDANGKEITDQFGFQLGDAAMACFEPGEPTTVSIEAVTDGQSIELSMEGLVKLCHKYKEVVDVYNRLLQEGMRKHQHIKTMIQFNGVADRYKWFLDEYPGLIDIVKHKDIASFIGTNPVNLSRVRKKLETEQG